MTESQRDKQGLRQSFIESENNILEQLHLLNNSNSMFVVSEQINKIIRRGEAKLEIKKLYSQLVSPYSIQRYFGELNTQFIVEGVVHDVGEKNFINISNKTKNSHIWDDGEECKPAEIDTFAAGIIDVNKREIPKKIGSPDKLPLLSLTNSRFRSSYGLLDAGGGDEEVRSQHSGKSRLTTKTANRGDGILKSSTMLMKKGLQHLQEKQEIQQVPLKKGNDDDEPDEIKNYRKQKQREYDRKEEERRQEELKKRRLQELQKEIRQQEEELAKKHYTYDSKGEVLFVKNVNVEVLPKDTNYEIKMNLRKPPTSIKGTFPLSKALTQNKKGKSTAFDSIENQNNVQEAMKSTAKTEQPLPPDASKNDQQLKRKPTKVLTLHEHLAKGKDLKRAFKDLKPMKDVIIPMGSNFDAMEPDMGVTIEERGKQKKGNQNFSIQLGKAARQDYMSKFNKTSLNFNSDSLLDPNPVPVQTLKSAQSSQAFLNIPGVGNNGRNAVDQGTKNEKKEQRGISMPPIEQVFDPMEGFTLQLTQNYGQELDVGGIGSGGGSLFLNYSKNKHLGSSQSVGKFSDRIKLGKNNVNLSSLLLSPTNQQIAFQMRLLGKAPPPHLTSNQDSFNQTTQTFLPQFNLGINNSKSRMLFNVPKQSELRAYSSQNPAVEESYLLPEIKQQFDDMNLAISMNRGQALGSEEQKGGAPLNQKKIQKKPAAQISSILKSVKSQQKMMSTTSQGVSFAVDLGLSKNDETHLQRARPYIEKISSSNKHHLPPPRVGKTLGHGLV